MTVTKNGRIAPPNNRQCDIKVSYRWMHWAPGEAALAVEHGGALDAPRFARIIAGARGRALARLGSIFERHSGVAMFSRRTLNWMRAL